MAERQRPGGSVPPLPGNMHDHLFRLTVTDPEAAAAVIWMALDPKVAARLDPDVPPQDCRTSFVDGRGGAAHVDGLWRVRLKDGGHAYVLAEHKSTRDRGTASQMLGYIAQLILYQQERGELQDGPVPIFPVVIYSGQPEWRGPLRLEKDHEFSLLSRYVPGDPDDGPGQDAAR